MWVVRAVRMEDLDALHALVQSATRGLTSLQLDRDRLLDRVEESVFAFSRSGPTPRGEPYVLVLSNDDTGELVGTSTIYAKTGGYQPFYAYQLVGSFHHSESLGVSQHRTRLELRRIHDGPTEIGSLFLRGTYRGQGRGRWLSLARFSLMTMLPHRFADHVIAEMRGKANPDGSVPFWDAVAGRFIPTEFAKVDTISTVTKQFIEEMMPKYPIYLNLLSDEVRQGIGQVHDETRPALAMLKREGFRETDMVDIFDGGPLIRCERAEIKAIQRCRQLEVTEVREEIDPSKPRLILSSDANGFTSTLTHLDLNHAGVAIGRADATRLDLEPGKPCVVLPLHPDESADGR